VNFRAHSVALVGNQLVTGEPDVNVRRRLDLDGTLRNTTVLDEFPNSQGGFGDLAYDMRNPARPVLWHASRGGGGIWELDPQTLTLLANHSPAGQARGITIVDNEIWIARFPPATPSDPTDDLTTEVGVWDPSNPFFGFIFRFSLPFGVVSLAYDPVEQVLWVGTYINAPNGPSVIPYRLDGTPINAGFAPGFPVLDYVITGLELGP
jgi:hypothetical protein